MARIFRVNVDGEQFEVSVEEITGGQPAVVAQPIVAAPVVKPQVVQPAKPAGQKPKPQSQMQPKPQARPAGGNVVSAPLPGTVTDIAVSVGQAVKAGEKLIVLEAMKMENDIAATGDGTVKEILVARGDTVQSGQALVVLE